MQSNWLETRSVFSDTESKKLQISTIIINLNSAIVKK